MMLFWEHKEVKLTQLNGLQTPSSPSSQTSFSPSSDAHPERKKQPVALISVAVRSKYAQGSFRTTLRQQFLSELRVNADAVIRSNVHGFVSAKRRHKKLVRVDLWSEKLRAVTNDPIQVPGCDTLTLRAHELATEGLQGSNLPPFLFSWTCRYFKLDYGLREQRHDACILRDSGL